MEMSTFIRLVTNFQAAAWKHALMAVKSASSTSRMNPPLAKLPLNSTPESLCGFRRT
jgi:hypothetical protein